MITRLDHHVLYVPGCRTCISRHVKTPSQLSHSKQHITAASAAAELSANHCVYEPQTQLSTNKAIDANLFPGLVPPPYE